MAGLRLGWGLVSDTTRLGWGLVSHTTPAHENMAGLRLGWGLVSVLDSGLVVGSSRLAP